MESTNKSIQERIQYLRENTDFVSAVFDNLIGYAIVAADFDGNIIAYNEGAHQIYGYTPEEIIGKENINIFFTEASIAAGRIEQIVAGLLDQGRVAFEGEMVRKNGSRFPAHKLFTLTQDKSGQVVGFVEIVQDLTKQKKAEALAEQSNIRLRRIIESNADSMLIVDREGIIRFVNAATEALFVRPEKELLGTDFGFPTSSGERTEIDIVRPVANGMAVAEMRVTDIEWQGQRAYLATLRDITERQQAEQQIKASLAEKVLLLKEIHHRVKNNLQIISSLLKLQTRYTGDEQVLEIFRESQNRISTMASVHSMLYNSENFTNINFGEYIRDTAKQLFRSYNTNPKAVSLKIKAEDCMLSIDTAIPCGLMINELISNALKHAFPGGRGGEILIGMNKAGNDIRIVFEDNGVGFPENLDFQSTNTLGMRLLGMLAKQLGGSIEMIRNGGTRFVILLKDKNTEGGVTQ
jgi:PAS domain S-box-containing protein